MNRYLYYVVSLGLVAASMSLRAADRPHAGTGSKNTMVWTNDNIEKLDHFGLISIVGRIDEERPALAPAPGVYARAEDPKWYTVRATELREKLERRQTQLREYKQAIEDARSLRKTTGGVNLDEDDIGITPGAGVEILEARVSEVQSEMNALEDLARRHDIPPGTLREQ